jgi:predicted AlkP superfamily pyrophosphatase or phosphodiesterase
MSTPPAGPLIRYGSASLSDVMPSALAALGAPNEPNPLQLDETDCVVVFLVDGLGWNLLDRYADCAPFLAGGSRTQLTVGFPTTTAASIASLGTGLPSGQHGLTGYTSRVEGVAEPINWLSWRGVSSGRDLSETVDATVVQPQPTAFQRAQATGIAASVVSAASFRGSGLTTAALRGGTYRPVLTAADTIATVVAAAAGPRPALIYCYIPDLDLIGHVRGTHSEAWAIQLALIDRVVETLAVRLPSGARLLVTGDHGMVDVASESKIDYDAEPELSADVEMLSGESRMRYLHVSPGRIDDVRARWADRLGERIELIDRDDAIAHGWFGPVVTPAAYGRIGDLIALPRGDAAVVRAKVEPSVSALVGQHGGLTADELLVPLVRY